MLTEALLSAGPAGMVRVRTVAADRGWLGHRRGLLRVCGHQHHLGAEVVLVDAAKPGRATAAGAGIICPWSAQVADPAWRVLAYAAAREYPALTARLADLGETDGPTERTWKPGSASARWARTFRIIAGRSVRHG